MYESPITVHTIADLMRSKTDQYIYECIEKLDVHVDRDELIRALEYDREQYEKGFIDGKSFYEKRKCSKCRFFVDDFFMNKEDAIIVGHEVCLFWGRGCKTDPDAFCSYFEDKTDETISK